MRNDYIKVLMNGALGLVVITPTFAGAPVWTFKTKDLTHVTVLSNTQATVRYVVTNQSTKTHTLRMRPITGVQSSGCTAPLTGHASCTLTLTVNGSALTANWSGGPALCEQANLNQCYQPSEALRLNIKKSLSTKVGVGNFFSALNTGLLAVKKGITGAWNFPVESGFTLSGTSCAGAGPSAICTAVGNYYGINSGVIFFSQNGGASWSQATVSNAGTYYATSCTGSSVSNSVCTAVGYDKNSNLLISVSRDGGASWSTASNPSIQGQFNATSCTGTGSSAICIAAGQTTNGGANSLLYVSTNGGTTWNAVTTNSFSLKGASCSGTGSSALCAAVGRQSSASSGAAALYLSKDGGQTWTSQTPANSQFNSVSCVGGNTGYCVASGLNTQTQKALSYITTDGGATWSTWDASENNSTFNGVNCTGSLNNAVCVAVGRDNDSSLPLVYFSNPTLQSWTKKTTATTNSTFNSVSCTGDNSDAVCIAAGQNISSNSALAYISKDSGQTWALESTNDAVGSFVSVSCSGVDTSLVCSAVGNSTASPFIFQSVNNGSSWGVVDLPTKAGSFNDVSCTGLGLDTVCVAVGRNYQGNIPLVYIGKPASNGLLTWRQVQTGMTKQGVLYGVSCTGSGNTSICSVVGYYIQNNTPAEPIVYVTRNGGASWNLINTGLSSAELKGTGCTGVGDTAICVAAGRNRSINTWPGLVLVSRNGGATWSQVATGDNQYLDSASCSGTGSTAVCAAVGIDYHLNLPLVYLSQNGGADWSVVNTSSLNLGEFLDVNCSGSGAKTICTASGQDYITGLSLLYYTQDGGRTWTYQPPLTPAVEQGIIYQTSCTGEAKNAVCASAGVYAGDLPSYFYLGLTQHSPLMWRLISNDTYSGALLAANCSGVPQYASCMIGGAETNSTTTPQTRPSLYLSNNAGTSWVAVPVDSSVLAGKISALTSN